MKTSPKKFRDYQLKAYHYAIKQKNPILYMDMRLGKTMIALRYAKQLTPLRKKRILVLFITLYSAFNSVQKDAIADGFDCFSLLGTKKQKMKTFLQAIENTQNTVILVEHQFFLWIPQILNQYYDCVIVDESHLLKEPSTKRTKFYRNNFTYKNTGHKVLLSGTPDPENLLDYFEQFCFADNQFLDYTNYYDFRCHLFYECLYKWEPKLSARKRILDFISNRAFKMDLKTAGYDIPVYIEKRFIRLHPEMKKHYLSCDDYFILQYKELHTDTKYAPVRDSWLLDICNGFIDNQFLHCNKLTELSYLLTNNLRKETVVIFFSRNNSIPIVSKLLDQLNMNHVSITGKIPVTKRIQLENDLHNGKYKILLAQVDCYTYGADLSFADTIIYYDTPVKTVAYLQSQKRILSLQKSRPLSIIHLITENTIEQDRFNLIEDKKYRIQNDKDYINKRTKNEIV